MTANFKVCSFIIGYVINITKGLVLEGDANALDGVLFLIQMKANIRKVCGYFIFDISINDEIAKNKRKLDNEKF